MWFQVRHDYGTYVIDIERHRVEGQFAYELGDTFVLEDELKPLSSLEADMPIVQDVFHFEIESSQTDNEGLLINATRYELIKAPLPRKQRGDAAEDGDCPDGDVDDIGVDAGSEKDFGDDASSELVVHTGLIINLDLVFNACLIMCVGNC